MINWSLIKKALKKKGDYYNYVSYYRYYKKLPLVKNSVLLESQRGANLNGNIFYLLKEMVNNKEFSSFHPYVVVNKKSREDFERLLIEYGLLESVTLITLYSKEYYKWCAQAEYLINDTSFLPFFIKKEGQKYLNTWHGTPLKAMGRKDMSGYHNLGNVQRNFLIADFLLYPNAYTRDHMIEDYMLENISPASSLMAGYPRNEIFFSSPEPIKEKLEIQDKKIYAYMPTWRGAVGKVDQKASFYVTMYYLLEMDKRLQDDEIMFVNLHPFLRSEIDYSLFQHIKPFPDTYETYEFLNTADVLVTDYSSVFYDFANTGRKIVLFAYDTKEYFEGRGVYEQLENLPFPITQTVDELMEELRKPKEYDSKDFEQLYNSYDSSDASKKVLEQFLLKKEHYEVIPVPNNHKNNVLLYGGNLAKNGLTSSLTSLLNSIDLQERNYILTFPTAKVKKNKEVLLSLPKNVAYIPIAGKTNAHLYQKVASRLFRKNRIPSSWMEKVYDDMYEHDLKRLYGKTQFSDYVHFTGYDYKRIQQFARAKANRVIFVHNNMGEEIRVRNTQHSRTLKYAYNNYDHIAIVSEDMMEPTKEFCLDENRIAVVNNTIDYKKYQKMGLETAAFDENTESTHTLEEVQAILDSNAKKFISVGRFSPEKGHEQLIEAFDEIAKEHEDVYLIIIGGHGVLYEQTLELRESLACKDRIVIIKSMSNPQPIIHQSDYFVLSSHHEGLGLVILEADIQNVPVVSTDILGPRGFMKKHGGTLVEDSKEGLVKGLKMCLNGQVKAMNADYEEYNQQAIEEFTSVLTPVKKA